MKLDPETVMVYVCCFCLFTVGCLVLAFAYNVAFG